MLVAAWVTVAFCSENIFRKRARLDHAAVLRIQQLALFKKLLIIVHLVTVFRSEPTTGGKEAFEPLGQRHVLAKIIANCAADRSSQNGSR